MGVGDWFLKEKDTDKIIDEPVSENKTKLQDSASLKDKVESVRTEKFNNFLNQLTALKSVAGLTNEARCQAAMVTSGISINEINSNLLEMKNKLKDESNQFQFELNNETGLKISELEVENKKNGEELKELTEVINDIKTEIENLKYKNSIELNEHLNIFNEIDSSITKLEDEIKINLKVE